MTPGDRHSGRSFPSCQLARPTMEWLTSSHTGTVPGDSGGDGGFGSVKTITICLPDVEAAMQVEVQKVNKAYRDLQGLLINQIKTEYQKTSKGRAAK